jgi:hypothetical protein
VDIHSYEQSQETLALLQILAHGKKQVESGQTHPLAEVIAKVRNHQFQEHESANSTDPGASANR